MQSRTSPFMLLVLIAVVAPVGTACSSRESSDGASPEPRDSAVAEAEVTSAAPSSSVVATPTATAVASVTAGPKDTVPRTPRPKPRDWCKEERAFNISHAVAEDGSTVGACTMVLKDEWALITCSETMYFPRSGPDLEQATADRVNPGGGSLATEDELAAAP